VANRDSGTILDGKYEIVERLAAGGMGEVYRARHIHLQEHRVIKILRADKATDGQALQRFTQEARIATQIKHPNVAILYDFSRLEDGSFYMVWEHIAGEDVGSALRTRGPLDPKLAVEIGIQALRGLDAIHSAGVIHRDISPDNLMLTRDRRGKPLLKIIDLGLAKNLEAKAGFEITQAGMFMGKLMYCSPEQAGALAEGVPLDHRSDLYSLAAVIYEMVTGRPPFDSESDHGYVLRRLTEAPLPMAGRTPGIRVPAPLEEVVMRGLERDRERRWPDALSFLHGLVKVADHLRQVSTQEIPALRAGPPKPLSSVSTRTTARTPSNELSREERLDLLAQIDRAAKRVSEASRVKVRAEHAIRERKFAEALELVAQLEAISPRHSGLVDLRAALAAARRGATPAPAPAGPSAREPETEVVAPQEPAATPAPAPETPPTAEPPVPSADELETRARVSETEKMLESYIREHKQALARFALDTLLELAPNHPRRADYESWVGLMGEEAAQLRDAEALLEEGLRAASRDDLDEARRLLAELDHADPSHQLTDRLRTELEEAENRQRSASELDRRRDRLEKLLEERRLNDAERELTRLASGGLARVSVDAYRLRIRDLAALAEREAQGRDYEQRCRERLAARDWAAAREVVLEFEAAVPSSSRPAQLFAEISRLEEIDRRQQGVEQGLRQIETFLAQRQLAEAEMALKIVAQMAPDEPRVARLGERLRALRGA